MMQTGTYKEKKITLRMAECRIRLPGEVLVSLSVDTKNPPENDIVQPALGRPKSFITGTALDNLQKSLPTHTTL